MPGIKETNNIRLQLAEVRDSNGNTHLKLDSDGLTELDNEGQVEKNHGQDEAFETVTGVNFDGGTIYQISHSQGEAPSVAIVTPLNSDAGNNFHVSDKTSNYVEVTYANVTSSNSGDFDLFLIF